MSDRALGQEVRVTVRLIRARGEVILWVASMGPGCDERGGGRGGMKAEG